MLNVTDGGTIQQTISFVRMLQKQIPYGTMVGINKLALEAQSDTENRLVKEKFTLRTPWYKHGNRFGFNISFANKEKLEATMGSRADWLKLQEDGGTKTPTASQNIAIPERENLGISPDQKIAKGERPRAITNLDGIFYKKMPSGTEGIWAREPGSRTPKLLYLFRKSAQVKARFDFVRTETELVTKRYDAIINTEIANAIATAKP